MLAHGSDVVYVPLFFNRRETFKRPCQLLVVNEPSPGVYEFDWSQVKRFTDMVQRIGFKKFEWSHLWIYWGVENPMRIYKNGGRPVRHALAARHRAPPRRPTSTSSGSSCPQFHQFLLAEKLLDDSYFHLSDEPGSGQHVENYASARKVLRELAPWMKVMDALSDIRYGKRGPDRHPDPDRELGPGVHRREDPALGLLLLRRRTGPWLNRFMDTPLPKVRMSGWLFYRLGAEGLSSLGLQLLAASRA